MRAAATVDRQQLEQGLAELQRGRRDPSHGLFGPGSLTWQCSGDATVFLAGGRAALMQLAHPFVATAIAQHSDAASNPLGRFQRTFDQVFLMVFGTVEDALTAARRVHRVHRRIRGKLDEDAPPYARGDVYQANNKAALAWVRATLVDSTARGYRDMYGDMPAGMAEGLYTESLRFAALFGLKATDLSPTWSQFLRYVDTTCARLSVTKAARAIGQALLKPPALRPAPLATWYRVWTTGLLPEPLRRGFELPFGPAEQRLYQRSRQWLPRLRRRIPARLMRAPGYADALRRLSGKSGRDPLVALLERVLLRAVLGSAGA